MSAPVQERRLAAIETSLGTDALLLREFDGEESLAGGFAWRVEVEAIEDDVDLGVMLGEEVTVRLEIDGGGSRAFSGRVTQVTVTDTDHARTLLLEPWSALLRHTRDSRVYREQSVVEIVDEVFSRHGELARHEWRLQERYPTLDFTVQYAESDAAFVNRLLERFGIYGYFHHDERSGEHTLVLVDHASVHESVPGYERVPFDPDASNTRRDEEIVHRWRRDTCYAPSAVATHDYDYRQSHTRLEASESWSDPDTGFASGMEHYLHPGRFGTLADGEREAQVRGEALQTEGTALSGESTARGLATGHVFELVEHPSAAQAGRYLIVAARYRFGASAYRSGAGGGAPFACAFEAIDADVQYRPPASAPRPRIPGVLSATVTGPAGEEIWTDEYGCVKLKFPWDRSDHVEDRASGWVRVSQTHAGKGFGAIDVPRVGEEVLVEFIDGDPDRPVVVGRVHNDFNTAAEPLPARAMVSGLRSNSTPGGGGYNEWLFDDSKGEEKVALRAEKDMTLLVRNDCSREIEHDETTRIAGKQGLMVEGDRTVEIGGAQSSDVATTVDLKAGAAITITSDVSITLEAGGSTIELGPSGIALKTSGIVSVQGSLIKLN